MEEENNAIQDNLTLGDIDNDFSSKKLSKETKYIIFGSIAVCLLIIIIIIILIIISSSKDNDNKGDNGNNSDEETFTEKIGGINCIFDIQNTNTVTQLISENYEKNSAFKILIEGKEIKYSKTYKFEKPGKYNVKFDLYQKINMDKMFQNIETLTYVFLYSDKNAEITSMQSTFEA